ncbi:RNA-binding protein 14-like [Pomacea canaliculata]|nr:RNA-binding protein 14-like [Pomacea canaliculata]
MTVKIFIGNLSSETQAEDVRVLFEKYGTVAECDVLKNYGFVHMTDKASADNAIANLDGFNVKGQRMRVELSTGKKGNPKGDRKGGGSRGRPYPPGPPPRERYLPPPMPYDRYDPYSRYPYPERDPYYRPLPPGDRYLPRLPPPGDRYAPLPPPRDRLMPEERRPYPDPRDRMLPPRDRMPLYPEDRSAYDRLRPVERSPLSSDPYYRERSPPARPPPEYYDRKPPLARAPAADAAASRLNTTAYPPANGYDYYRQPPERSDFRATSASAGDYYAPSRAGAGYDRGASGAAQAGNTGGGFGVQQSQANKSYDSQSALQTQPIFF